MAVSLLDRLKRRRAQLAETRLILSKRSETVNERKRQQRHARHNLERGVKNHVGQARLDALTRKLAYAHELLEKAVLGHEAYEARERFIEKKVAVLEKKISEAQHSTTGASVPAASWNPNRRPIANWIIPILYKSAANGWHGYVTSGYRSAAYQCEVCKGVCGNCGGCPGTCAAPGTSNHGRADYPGGAVDVTDYYTFAAVQRRIGSPLHNSLGSQDPVHFSYYGN